MAKRQSSCYSEVYWSHTRLINKDSLVTNSQETNESAATLAQTSEVQAVLVKLAAVGSLLSGKDEGEEAEELDTQYHITL